MSHSVRPTKSPLPAQPSRLSDENQRVAEDTIDEIPVYDKEERDKEVIMNSTEEREENLKVSAGTFLGQMTNLQSYSSTLVSVHMV